MFDIGFSELVVIAVLALIILGPERLPEVARTAGRWLAKLRNFISNVKQDFDQQLNTEDLAELKNLKLELEETRRQIELTTSKTFSEVARSTDVGGTNKGAPSIQKSRPPTFEIAQPLSDPAPPPRARRPRKKSAAKTKHGQARKAAKRR